MRSISNIIPIIFFSSMLLSMAGCESGGSTPNVTLTAVGTPQASSYQSGQPFTVTFTTDAVSLDVDNIAVQFVLIERSKVDQLSSSDVAETFEAGDYSIANLQTGTQEHTATLSVPHTAIPAGDYVIAAYVDPTGIISNEADTSDNLSRGIEEGDETTYGTMTIASGNYHDFVLDSVAVGDGFALFPSPGMKATDNTGLPAGVRPDMVGYFYASKNGTTTDTVDVGAVVAIGGVDYPAHLWHKVEQRYVDRMRILFPANEQSHYFPWNIAINGTLLQAIHDDFDPAATENTMQLTLTLYDTSGSTEASAVNNTITVDIPYALFKDSVDVSTKAASQKTIETRKAVADTKAVTCTVSEVASGGYFSDCGSYVNLWQSYGWTLGNSSTVAVEPYINASFIAGNGYGGRAAVSSAAGVNLHVFDSNFTLIEGGMTAESTVSTATFTYWAGLDVFGITILEEGDTVASYNATLPLHSWEESKDLVDSTFVLVVVPINVTAGIEGTIETNLSMAYESLEFSITGEILNANLSLTASGGATVGIYTGGVGVNFLVFEDILGITGTMSLVDAATKGQISFNANASNQINAISGEFYLFVEYPVYKWCCKTKTKRQELTIYETDAALSHTYTFFDETYIFNF